MVIYIQIPIQYPGKSSRVHPVHAKEISHDDDSLKKLKDSLKERLVGNISARAASLA